MNDGCSVFELLASQSAVAESSYHGCEGVAQAPLCICSTWVDFQRLLEFHDGLREGRDKSFSVC
eukprot:1160923-Pelagomonas_calceolata.AAC.3